MLPTLVKTCVLCRVQHKIFLRAAADHRAVDHAMRFVQLLPNQLTDARTYNMLVSVCIAARDLPGALKAGELLKRTGRKLDTYMYTSLITGESIPACTPGQQLDNIWHTRRNFLLDGCTIPTDTRGTALRHGVAMHATTGGCWCLTLPDVQRHVVPGCSGHTTSLKSWQHNKSRRLAWQCGT